MKKRFMMPEIEEIKKCKFIQSNSRLKNLRRWLKSMNYYGYTKLKLNDEYGWMLEDGDKLPNKISCDIEWITQGIFEENETVSIQELIKLIKCQ